MFVVSLYVVSVHLWHCGSTHGPQTAHIHHMICRIGRFQMVISLLNIKLHIWKGEK